MLRLVPGLAFGQIIAPSVSRPKIKVAETFDTMPADIITNYAHQSATGGNPDGCLLSNGYGAYWYFNGGETGRFWADGDADFSWDVYLASGGRDIANCAFWVENAGPAASGFWFRIEPMDAFFYYFQNGSPARYLGQFDASPTQTWLRLLIQTRGTVVTGLVTVIATGAVVNSFSVDVASTLADYSKLPRGTMGQTADGAGGYDGIRFDNVTLEK